MPAKLFSRCATFAIVSLAFLLLAPSPGLASKTTLNRTKKLTRGYNASACDSPYTPIYQIQGSGASAAVMGDVTTQGIVIGDYEGPSPELRGFYIQEAAGDEDDATSDGMFVFNGDSESVELGDLVRVSGTAGEFQAQTQISDVTEVVICDTDYTVEPVQVTLPFADAAYPERFEGMLVRLPQTLYVTENFQLGQFGQVALSSSPRLEQPTQIVAPGAPALAMQAANSLDRIILDDANQLLNPDPITIARGGNPLTSSNTLRSGDSTSNIVGVLTYTWGGTQQSPNAYRIRPFHALGGSLSNFVATNARPSAPPVVGGTLRIASMNLLNYYNTFSGCINGVGGTPKNSNCRGAGDADEFQRQYQKIIAAIVKLNPDILAVNELENDGYDVASAIYDLVTRLNAATAAGTYAFIDVDARTGQVNALGTDVIKIGVIYKPAKVTLLGTAALNTVAFVSGGDGLANPRNRATFAQAFQENATGEVFVLSPNHFKSRSSECNTPDAGDGQGDCAVVRKNGATALATWLATDPTDSNDPDVLILGDLNSYAKEDSITALKNAGYLNLVDEFIGEDAYSYGYNGQWGYLDHALGSSTFASQVSGVAEYHINADEPSVLDYQTESRSAGQLASLYAANEFRASDHDALLIGLSLSNPTPTPTDTPTRTHTPTQTITGTRTNTPTASVTPSVTPTDAGGASPTPTGTVTASGTPTASPTATLTATATNTTISCANVAPGAFNTLKPNDGATLYKSRLLLRWTASECANIYRITLRQSSKKGPPLANTKTTKTSLRTKTLPRGSAYFWRVKACNTKGCAVTPWRKFELKP